ncbi:MAG: YraN family protein [Firmicutes bacterium HGW-Firmicutes-12]|nr:MAG: YraN family protein [Firmicutes bacterium HGW-Firmicutes-12]
MSDTSHEFFTEYYINEQIKQGESMDRIKLGRKAEEAAAEYIIEQGYIILERNCRFHEGEIDIIAEHQGELVFIEVRSRQSSVHGYPQETVNYKKQQKLKRLANHYLKLKRAWNRNCRFDVIGILFDEEGRIMSLELISNAF